MSRGGGDQASDGGYTTTDGNDGAIKPADAGANIPSMATGISRRISATWRATINSPSARAPSSVRGNPSPSPSGVSTSYGVSTGTSIRTTRWRWRRQNLRRQRTWRR